MTNAYDIAHFVSFEDIMSKEKGLSSLKSIFAKAGIKYSLAKAILTEYFRLVPEVLVNTGEYTFPELGKVVIRRYKGTRTKMLDYAHHKKTGEIKYIYDNSLERNYFRCLWIRPFLGSAHNYRLSISIRCWRTMKKRIDDENLHNNYPLQKS
ncbi:MAG: hypothetical protein EBU90_01580 [Proteobacteria bacterium]|nr:hypothetical protein [Pseudomonadota bacterium]